MVEGHLHLKGESLRKLTWRPCVGGGGAGKGVMP